MGTMASLEGRQRPLHEATHILARELARCGKPAAHGACRLLPTSGACNGLGLVCFENLPSGGFRWCMGAIAVRACGVCLTAPRAPLRGLPRINRNGAAGVGVDKVWQRANRLKKIKKRSN